VAPRARARYSLRMRNALQGSPVLSDGRFLRVVRYLSYLYDPERVTEVIRGAVRELLDADGACFILREGELAYYADEDAIAPLWKGRRFPLGECLSGRSMLRREPAVVEDALRDPRAPRAVYEKTFVRGLALMPIRLEDPVGALGAYWARPHRATPAELDALRGLADVAGLALMAGFRENGMMPPCSTPAKPATRPS
jgi:putative two-component system response regulator